MTLDNCIKRYEIWASDDRISPDIREEHKQIAKWLNNYKKMLEQEPCEDCRNCNKWSECECGEVGHKNGTSIGYSIGNCKEYEPCDCISREYILSKAHCCRDDLADDEPCCVDVDDIKNAPSVQPKPIECEDCISRKEAINAISHAEVSFQVESDLNFENYKREVQEIADGILKGQVKAISDLPSVQPKPKTDVLDKIRAEIIARNRNIKAVRSDGCCFFTTDEILNILDKYRAEKEGI